MYSKCQKCGRKLTDPESIERGYGPECWNGLTTHYYPHPEDWEKHKIPGQMTIEDFLGDLKTESNSRILRLERNMCEVEHGYRKTIRCYEQKRC